MAEWLRRGLQILARRFDSGSGLQYTVGACPDFVEISSMPRNSGGTGLGTSQAKLCLQPLMNLAHVEEHGEEQRI